MEESENVDNSQKMGSVENYTYDINSSRPMNIEIKKV